MTFSDRILQWKMLLWTRFLKYYKLAQNLIILPCRKKVKICSVQATALCFKYVSYWPCWCSKKQLLCWYQLLGRNYEQKLIILHILESKFIISMFFSKCIFYQWNPAEKWWSLTMLVKKSNIFHCKVLEWEGNDLAFLLLKNVCTQPNLHRVLTVL